MFRVSALRVIPLASLLLLAGCDQPSSREAQDKLAAVELRMSSLEGAVSKLDARLTALDGRTIAVETQEKIDSALNHPKDVAYLTPTSEDYAVVESSVGSLAVSLQDVRPYANGSRVILEFGNPTTATITGISMQIEWGKSSENYSTIKSRQFAMTDNLRAGAWTKIPVVLDGVPPADLGFVRVQKFKNDGITLTAAQPR